ncbi:hypothetical protein [Kushneria phosphatilytica]|uniref:Uncharacterized protein n=1 Tax=Kushneria phosphatilytica TaxID=657387 RepID=A0A5C1A324_9GAMM|nr:hypothetical protein [Kushneria phosphatilytica]QEL11345.1 hypothetical protein FY550_09470 [Kushneria phosphatilytica]
MADVADRGSQLTEQLLDEYLKVRRPTVQLEPIGECRNPLCCLELDDPRALYCDPGCAEEHQWVMERER